LTFAGKSSFIGGRPHFTVMLVCQLKSKIHRAMVTRGDVEYEGSIEIPQDLVEAAGLWPGEKVLVASVTSGNRFETYVLVGPPGTGQIIVNGAAAHLIGKGERIIIMSFAWDDKPITPRRVICNELNEIIA
jgi:aspartate 1-decarboxylase